MAASLGHHQSMTREMRTFRVQYSLGPMPWLHMPLLRLLAVVALQPALTAATRVLPPNRDATLLSARPPHLAASLAISAAGAGVHLRSSLSQLLMEGPARGATHMNGPEPQRPSQDESTGHPPPKVAPPPHQQKVRHKAERNASLDHQSFALEPGFVAAVRGAYNSATQRQDRSKSGNRKWPPQQPPPQPSAQPAPSTTTVEEITARSKKWLGLPKLLWAIFLDVIAMLIFIACIPFILTIAKRRRAQPSQS